MEDVREIMTQKVSVKIAVQRGICKRFAYSFYLQYIRAVRVWRSYI